MPTISISPLIYVVLRNLIASPVLCTQAAFYTFTTSRVDYSNGGGVHVKQTHTILSQQTSLFRKKEKPSWFDEREDIATIQPVRYLGKARDAIIRPGVVLVAPDHEYNHFLTKSAVFIHAIGLDKFGERVTRGVVIDHPTAFTMGEMAPGTVCGVLANNLLFQGGDQGGDKVILLHNNGAIGKGVMIGSSGIYEGGLNAAMETVDDGDAEAEKFKFFFNYVEFNDNEIANMMSAIDTEGDAWMSVEVPIEMILDSDMNRSDAWRSLRRELKTIAIEDESYEM